MLRAMVFIDFENFDISKYNYYRAKCLEDAKSAALAAGTPVPTHVQTVVPKLDFNKIPKEVVNLLSNPHTLVKTFCLLLSQTIFSSLMRKENQPIIGLRV